MNEIENSHIFPVALWLKEAPTHNISSLIFLNKKKFVISGCENGHIIIWSLNTKGDELIPIYYLIGHKSKVTNLILAGSSNNTTLEYFVSFSDEGEIALWEAEEGRNIEFVTNPQLNIQYAFSYESTNTKQRLILCCLKNREIFVFNSMSLAHICTLVCTSSPNWFSSVTSFNKSTKDDVILATSVSGLISIWNINFTDVLNQNQGNLIIDADQYVDIGTSNSFKITQNQYSDSIVLIITPNRFKICHIENWSVLSFQDCLRGDYFIDGDFVSVDSIVLHTQSGKSLLYQLPPRANCESISFREKSSNICDCIPILLFEFSLNQPNEIGKMRHKIQIQKINEDIIIWKAFSNGNIYRWECNNQSNKMPQNLFTLENIWTKIKKTPTSLTKSMEVFNVTGTVTCLLFIHDLSIIVLGMENGWIILRSICDTLIHTFTENDSVSNNHVILKGHSGPVTCLLHPSSTMRLSTLMTSTTNMKSHVSLNLLRLTHILWSGGVDYTIRVWNLKNEKMLNIFHCHSAPLVSLKLNHLPLNSGIMCGVSQGFTAAMLNTVNENEENSHDIKQMINMCMNAFVVGIGENDDISIISVMKQKVLLYASQHKSPVRNLGWFLDSGYLLVDTVDNTVFVWDLSTGIMDRLETGEKARLLMENCPSITKIRSKKNFDIITGCKSVRRHSLSNIVPSDSTFNHGSNNKLLRSQFIYGDDIRRQVPILIFNISALLDSLTSYNTIPTSICDILDGVENLFPMEQKTPSPTKKKLLSDFDLLIRDVKLDKQNFNLKILLIKIILSITNLSSNNFPFSSIMFNADKLANSVGQINSKTGCVAFSLKPLFQDLFHLTTENMLIQLSISNKIISLSKSALFDAFLNIYLKQDRQNEIVSNISPSLSLSNSNGLSCSGQQQSSSLIVKSFNIHKKSILNKFLIEHLKSFKGEVNDLSFNILENIFNKLIIGILDICDTISKSSLQLMAKVINNLTDQQIQNYILIWRIFLSSNQDSYGLEDGRTFLNKIKPFLDKFIEFSYLSSDWIWWYSKDQINTDHEKRNLSKIQIKALLNIALVGSHLLPDEMNDESENLKLFSKLFTLDKSFLARITCDFLMSVLSRKPQKSKSNIGRLVNLAMICLSNGFLVWEPYLDSNTVICKFLHFAIDLEDTNIDDKFLSLVSRKAIENIATVRPLVFIMVCYREMLRLCTSSMGFSSSPFSSSRTIDRRKSSPALNSLMDNDKNSKPFSLLNRNILVPIFNDLCQHQSNTILDVLPELVELYIFFYIKEEDFSSFMLPVSKYSSVSLNESSGQVSVGSKNGSLFLFDLKIGKYYNSPAHKKSIRITKFSDDGKLVATYCVVENTIKIWQISTGLFSLGGNAYQVKLINSQVIPSLEQMLTGARKSSKYMKKDHVLEKESDIYLEWDTDNKILFIKICNETLKQIKI